MSQPHGVLAIISKKVFDKDFRGVQPGAVLDVDRYNSSVKALDALGEGLPLFLVTVRPSGATGAVQKQERLYLVAILESLSRQGSAWVAAAANNTPVVEINDLIPELRFTTGKGITAKPGALGMSLQTPRSLTEEDVKLLRGAAGGKTATAKKQAASKKPASKAKKAAKKKSAAKEPAKKKAAAAGGAVEQRLEAALSALRAEQPDQALSLLLDVWHQLPAQPVAEAIEAVSAQITAHKDTKAVAGKSKDAVRLWPVLARKSDPADLDRLLGCLTDVPAADAAARLDALMKWPDDPRFDMAVARTFEAIPFRATSTQKFWRRLLKRAPRLRDGRTLPVLERLDALYAADYDTVAGAWLRERVQGLLADLGPTLRENAALEVPGPAAELLRQLAEVHRPGTGVAEAADHAEAQLRRVLEHPDDDEARLIYADLLTQLGDPRGELIVLQYQRLDGSITPAGRKREKELLKTHVKDFLGPLAPLIMKKGLELERGFLSRCVISDKSPATIDALVGHPLWATVTHMEGPLALLLDPGMRSLRSVVVESDELAALCSADRDLPFEALRSSIYDDENDGAAALLAQGARLPVLRDLSLWAETDASYEAVIKGRVAARLERLCLRFDARPVASGDFGGGRYPGLHVWLARVEKHRPGLPTLEMDFNRSDCWGSHYTFRGPDARGCYTELEVEFDAPPNTRGWIEEIAEDVAGVLDGLSPKQLRAVVLRTRQRGKMDRRARAVLKAAKRFKGIERLEVPLA